MSVETQDSKVDLLRLSSDSLPDGQGTLRIEHPSQCHAFWMSTKPARAQHAKLNLAREIGVVASTAMPHSYRSGEHMYLSNAFNVHELPGCMCLDSETCGG